jgi:uncharacterized protein
MELNQNEVDDVNLITSLTDNTLIINGKEYSQSCIVSNEIVNNDLKLNSITQLSPQHIIELLASKPEIVIFGSGITHQFPDVKLLEPIAKINIGFEVMNNQSAARTYNVLITEGRKVASLFILND